MQIIFIKQNVTLNHYVLIIFCRALKKYTYFDVLSKITKAHVMYNFNCSLLFNITFKSNIFQMY